MFAENTEAKMVAAKKQYVLKDESLVTKAGKNSSSN